MRLTLVILVLTATRADACSVPVFRYALEHWAPSPYEVLVFHDRPLTAGQLARLRTLEGVGINAAVRPVAVASMKDEHRAVFAARPAHAPLPWVSVRYPDSEGADPAAWGGPLDALPALADSPARRELAGLLGKGTAAVWVLLDGDAATERMVRGELSRLEAEMKLPEVAAADLKSRLPLKLSFAVVKISRAGPEADLARELLGSDEGLRRAEGPVLFPVVGRGRMLFGLHGKGLTPGEVAQAAAFACGACSCQVKELNPGIDLLLRADWQRMLDVTDAEETSPAAVAPPIPPGRRAEARPAGESAWVVPAALVGAVALGVVWRAVARKGSA
ncbi:MAG: hypothetical protein ACRC33_02030 [Gemmataceae bacterium]